MAEIIQLRDIMFVCNAIVVVTVFIQGEFGGVTGVNGEK